MTTRDVKYIVGFIGIGKMGFPMASRIAADHTEIFRMLDG
jgi:3-hydroxyisobutyrate dehydrogenase-like beta-hydroxyacid dehydrogenase